MRSKLKVLLCGFVCAALFLGCGHDTKQITDETVSESGGDAAASKKERTETNFRKAAWGDSTELIRDIETAEETSDSTDEMVTFNGEVCGYNDTVIGYMVDEEYGFYQGAYMFELPSRPSATMYIEDYQKVKENLVKVYGEPDYCEEPRVVNDLADYVNDADHSLLMGYLGYVSEWDIPEKNTTIQLVLYGESFKMNLLAVYSDTNYEDNRDYTEGL